MAALVLWAGAVWAQTITMSPTEAQTLREGEALEITLTVSGLSTGRVASIDFTNVGRTASLDDFEVYQQADKPTGTDTPLELATDVEGYAYYDFAEDSDPAGPVTFWVLAKTDTVLMDPDLSLPIQGVIYRFDPSFEELAKTAVLTVTLKDAAPDPEPDPDAPPTTPANLTATAGRGAATLTWDAINDTSSNTNRLNDLQITNHQVRRSTDGGNSYGNWNNIPDSAPGGLNDTSYTIDGLTDGTEYTFQVRAVNGCTPDCGNSDPATAVMVTPAADARARPTGLAATAGNTQVTLTWDDPGDATITYYEYQQKAGLAAFGNWTSIPFSTTATRSYQVEGLTNGTAYVYRIRAGRGTVTSLASDAVTVTPRGVPPAAPVFTVTPRDGGVTLSWPSPFDAALPEYDPTVQEYEYQYKIGAGVYGPWRAARNRSAAVCVGSNHFLCDPPYLWVRNRTTLQISVAGLDNGTPHTFRLRARNADGPSTYNEVPATPMVGVPAKPTGLTTWVEFTIDFVRYLEWDRVEDASIEKYQYTVDDGRTWSDLTTVGAGDFAILGREEFISPGYVFRIRAVNAAGPSPKSDPASDPTEEEQPETVADSRPAANVSVEWDSVTKKVTVAWDAAEDDDLRVWSVNFFGTQNRWNKVLPIGTTSYEIPETVNAGFLIRVKVAGCLYTLDCLGEGLDYEGFRLGVPQEAPSGFSVTPGDRQITLKWKSSDDSSITHFEYEVDWDRGVASRHTDIPDGPDTGDSAADETSHTVTTIRHLSHHPEGAPVNGNRYHLRLRAASNNGGGPWTEWIRGVMPLAPGVPAAPTGLVTLSAGGGKSLTTWDDPQDPSITRYQQLDRGGREWEDIPGTDATTTGAHDLHLGNPVVRAVNANGVGPPGSGALVQSPAPAQPTGLRAAPGNGRVTLTWDDAGPGIYIQSWRYTRDDGATWNVIGDSRTTVEGHLTRHTVTGLTNGQAYTFAIQAVNYIDASTASATATATPQGGAPAKPTGLAAAPGNAQATLTWDNPRDASITKYQIKQDTAAWADIPGSDAGTTSHTVGSLTNGTAVTLRIRAVNDHNSDGADNLGPASDAVSVTPGVPAAPTGLTATPGDGQVTLTWTAPGSTNGSAVTGYEYTSNADAATPSWTDVPDSGTVSSLTNNITYTFAVRAQNANGPGAATPTVRATPVAAAAPQRPALKAFPGHQAVRLAWALPSFQHPVTGYEYRQSRDGGATWSPDWKAIASSGAKTTEHRLDSLVNGTTYTLEVRGLNAGVAGPAARAQATPGPAAASKVITPESTGVHPTIPGFDFPDRNTFTVTAPDGDTYTVTRLSLPEDLNYRITVPGSTDIAGRTFTLLDLQGATPETSERYIFTDDGQEGLDIEVDKDLTGPVEVCLEPSERLRLQASQADQRLLLLHYDGMTWTRLPTTDDGDMVCADVSSFSAFVLGYANAATSEPPVAGTIPAQALQVGGIPVTLDLNDYFTDPDMDDLSYTATSTNSGVVTTVVSGSQLTLTAGSMGTAEIEVTARDTADKTGMLEFTITVTAVTAPPPQLAQPTEAGTATATSVTVSWVPPAGSAVTEYEYQVKVSGKPWEWPWTSENPRVVPAGMHQGTVGGPHTANSFTDRLFPNQAYDFRVRAVNSMGAGAWSDTLPVMTAAPAKPAVEIEPGEVVTEGFAASLEGQAARFEVRVAPAVDWSLRVFVQVDKDVQEGCAIPDYFQSDTDFVIPAGEIQATFEVPFKAPETGGSPCNVAAKINAMDHVPAGFSGNQEFPGAYYEVGTSDSATVASDGVAMEPQAGAPGAAADVALAAKTAASLIVAWSPPATNPESVTGYLLTLEDPSGAAPAVEQQLGPEARRGVFDGLAPDTDYAVSITAEPGRFAEAMLVHTASQGTRAFTIYHDPAGPEDAAGRRQEALALLDGAGASWEVRAVEGTEKVDGLAGVENSILPRFFLDDPEAEGWGPSEPGVNNGGLRWLREQLTSPQQQVEPPGAATDVAVAAQTATSLAFAWGPPLENAASVTGYRVALETLAGGAPVEQQLGPEARSAVFDGLAPGTEYSFSITAEPGQLTQVMLARTAAPPAFVVYHDPNHSAEASERYATAIGLLDGAGRSYAVRTVSGSGTVDRLAGVSGSVLPRFFRGDPEAAGWGPSQPKVNNGGLKWLRSVLGAPEPLPTLSVADGEAHEGAGAAITFAVSLSRAVTHAVTVDYATADGTAQAGADYTATSGTLTFAPGETAQTVSVPVLDDSHDDDGETFTLRLAAAQGADIADGEATGTIHNTDPAQQAWIARFGRTVADQVLAAVDARMTAPHAAGRELTLGGHRVGLEGAAGVADEADDEAAARDLAAWLRDASAGPGSAGPGHDPAERLELQDGGMTEREFLLGSSFSLTAGEERTGHYTLWGRGAVSRFDGAADGLTLDGELASAFLGADWSRERMTAGLIVGHSRGDGGYDGVSDSGTLSSTLTGLYPWLRHALTERLSVWGVAGYGEGTLTLTPAEQAAMRAGLDLMMGAVGMRGTLLAAPGGIELAVTSDALALRTRSASVNGAGGNLAGATAEVTRLRLGLEGSRAVRFRDGAALTLSLEVGVRHDDGDAETGFGVDVGGGVAWSDPAHGLSADLQARGLVSHDADGFRDVGLSGSLSWAPRPGSGRGPNLTLTQTMGASATGGMHALLNRDVLGGLAAGADDSLLAQRRLEARFGYGFAAFGGGFTATPEAGVGLSDTGRDYRLGWRFSPGSGDGAFELTLEALRHESAIADGSAPENRVGVGLQTRW